MSQFFPEFEELLHNLKAFKKETILFNDFNIDTLKDSTDKMKYKSMLAAYKIRLPFLQIAPSELSLIGSLSNVG